MHYIEDVCTPEDTYISVRVDHQAIYALQLELTTDDIVTAIVKSKLKVTRQDIRIIGNKIRIYVREMSEKTNKTKEDMNIYARVQVLKRAVPDIIVKGYPQASRAVISKDEKTQHNLLLVEGYGLKACMNTDGVVGTETTSNHIMEVREVLGIEAARYESTCFSLK